MTAYYDVTEKLKNLLNEEPLNTTTILGDTTSDIDEIDNDKHVLFPLTQILVESANLTDNTILFNIRLITLDIVDFNKDAPKEPFKRNDNQQDVLNARLALLSRVFKKIKNNFTGEYQVGDTMALEPFNERFENNLAGWEGVFDLTVQNNMTRC